MKRLLEFLKTSLKGCYLIHGVSHNDDRGSFERLFCRETFKKKNLEYKFINTNYSFNKKAGTIRGMHMQRKPYEEVKLVRCVEGSIFDVAIDMRLNSPTRYKWYGTILSTRNNCQLYIPKGFAHGYQSLEDQSAVIYMVSEVYKPEFEFGISYNDPKISIDWPLEKTNISLKDSTIKDINFKK